VAGLTFECNVLLLSQATEQQCHLQLPDGALVLLVWMLLCDRKQMKALCVSIREVGDILQMQYNTWREVVSSAALIFSNPDIPVNVSQSYLKFSYNS